jgi:glucose/arabinose dehydrogenase
MLSTRRIVNSTCALFLALSAWNAPNSLSAGEAPPLVLQKFAEGFVSPTALISLPDSSGKMLLVDQIGIICVLTRDGKVSDKPFLNITNRLTKLNQGFDERGLLGLALHPKFKENGKFYVFYSAPHRPGSPPDWDCTSRVSEFKIKAGSEDEADDTSERVLLEIDKPYFNHNGGSITFGPDGYLYISVGDGGNGNDTGKGHSPIGNGQDLTTILGKILRIDVDHGTPYGIPKDNPFQEGKARPEIYAYGIRNAWRMSFDKGGSHELFAADVGQDLFEEVDIIQKGGNYGWNVREGFHCFNVNDPKKPLEKCAEAGADGKPFIEPILEYSHLHGPVNKPEGVGTSVTGGYVYRGKALPELTGKYIFGDWSRYFVKGEGILLTATRSPEKDVAAWSLDHIRLEGHPDGKITGFIVAFGQDEEGEIYVMTNSSSVLLGKNGKVWKLVAGKGKAE